MVTGVCSSAGGDGDVPDTTKKIVLVVVIIQFGSYLVTWKLNSPKANYKMSTSK
jgi:hypothetical protein